LSWLRARGWAWEPPCNGHGNDSCSSAASGGHLAVLQWLRANACPWNEYTCSEAAANGHLQLLQWARANGCPWGEGTCTDAARLEMGTWLCCSGCVPIAARGMMTSARFPLEADTWLCCSGCALMAAPGM
jgi:hypothetical protein